nr:hypothetical protein [Peptoanaerobacter stomatis]
MNIKNSDDIMIFNGSLRNFDDILELSVSMSGRTLKAKHIGISNMSNFLPVNIM